MSPFVKELRQSEKPRTPDEIRQNNLAHILVIAVGILGAIFLVWWQGYSRYGKKEVKPAADTSVVEGMETTDAGELPDRGGAMRGPAIPGIVF